MIEVNRRVTRQTAEYDWQTRKPYVIRLEEGGKLVRLKVKGRRQWYTVTVKDLWNLAVRVRAAEIRAEKKARREARRQGL